MSLTYLSSALVAVHRSDPTDLRRRLVKEDHYTFGEPSCSPNAVCWSRITSWRELKREQGNSA